MKIQEFVSGRPKQHVILGGDFNASLYGMTDCFHVGGVDSKTKNAGGHERLTESES